jgi:hypothetical protein
MHSLAIECCPENFRVLVCREHEDLIKIVFPNDRVAVPRERQSALLAECTQVVKMLADALLFPEHDPVRAVY